MFVLCLILHIAGWRLKIRLNKIAGNIIGIMFLFKQNNQEKMLAPMTVFSAIAPKYSKEKTTGRGQGAKKKEMPVSGWIIFITISIALAKGGDLAGIPSAYILVPMLVIGGTVRKGGFSPEVNSKLQTFVQIGIGGLTGVSINSESLLKLPQYVVPVLALNLLVIGAGLLMAKIFMKITDWDKLTCLLSCCPSGSSPIIMVALEYGADANIVTIFQVLRMITVLIIAPFMIKY